MSDIKTLDEYKAYMKALGTRGNGKESPWSDGLTVKLALQAAVLAENLTGDKHWDHYLQCLQGSMEDFKEGERQNLELLADPRLVDHSDILRLKLALADMRGAIRALMYAIELPQTIKTAGKEAKSLTVLDTALTSS